MMKSDYESRDFIIKKSELDTYVPRCPDCNKSMKQVRKHLFECTDCGIETQLEVLNSKQLKGKNALKKL